MIYVRRKEYTYDFTTRLCSGAIKELGRQRLFRSKKFNHPASPDDLSVPIGTGPKRIIHEKHKDEAVMQCVIDFRATCQNDKPIEKERHGKKYRWPVRSTNVTTRRSVLTRSYWPIIWITSSQDVPTSHSQSPPRAPTSLWIPNRQGSRRT
ncbi:hypothetical protein CIRG_00945 [Coccidioides immitis RMSCC 2394]|uniref:Uncharacterized protein n=1 Tax=Coccidioides immitis RMSCC 2394 TaxID=404692 RepID=A0A0J6Y2H0_COCIT|nr:hypothetical protein CIRG_00945 [Coccidioides immitis RMSCC 2394]